MSRHLASSSHMENAELESLREEIKRRDQEIHSLKEQLRYRSCQPPEGSSSCQPPEGSSSCQPPEGSSSSQPPEGSSSSQPPEGSSSSQPPEGSSSSQPPEGSSSSQPPEGSSSCQPPDGSSSPPRLRSTNEELPALSRLSLSNPEILRYSRQLVLPEFGVRGQLRLSQCSVLVVGCGGLGCPLAQYLAAAGVGRLGLLDYDEVEMNNLHRQVLHSEKRIGMAKATSMATALQQLNSNVEYVPYQMALSPANAVPLIRQYDIVADCSDNVPTRYLISDACVVAGKPLVSASALRWEGQLTIYNHQGGPCYRCLFPIPPPPETVTNCADGGVLGVVPGIMGCLQALEVIQLASGLDPSYSSTMLMYDALDGRFRNIRLRGKRKDCVTCSSESESRVLEDYEAFCGSSASDKCRALYLLSAADRMTVQEYKQLLDDGVPHLLIDVRPQAEVDICHLTHSVHIPLSQLEAGNAADLLGERTGTGECGNHWKKLIVICKLGNDSQRAVKILQRLSEEGVSELTVKDIAGGLMAWAEKIDPAFPKY
ncbi:adenylyltransferase and sulfurtransferase MOCS3 [Rana temporaria]|uniref:adenylyltransferase and sulfurtransferase MOCS3 n=1 Tax=Rana temporaria TaxID=8407 RepID=UPI001AACF31E|nr:adenylyltransferase and sulfurtransferase MOCS3 [Rana temporaria]